ncbi:MAG: DUF104 domain-containing protein [Candidatus Sumerlaeia bacterium]|nr:DUF104 domain-containing protein [Candidatus Sumerlaeia bacterium]
MKAIHAVYENSVFRPTEPVDLPEHSTVRVEPVEPQKKSMTYGDLAKFAGTIKVKPGNPDPTEWQRRMRDEEWL